MARMFNRKKIIFLSLVATLLSGCSLHSVKMVDGTRIPLSELTKEVRWIDEPELLTLQVYSQITVGRDKCTELTDSTLEKVSKIETEFEAQLEEWWLPNMSDDGLENLNRIQNALVEHYDSKPTEEFCTFIKDELSKVVETRQELY